MTANLASALFPGKVTHTRLRPREHRLAYGIYSLLIDLDELPALATRFRLFSVGRFNLFSFHPKDRGDGSGADLKGQVERIMLAAGLMPDGGPIRVLTMPRVLGWSFNPISVFFCYRRSGELTALLYEVDNTFGERHGYLIPVEEGARGDIHQTCAKAFHVSPFMDMDLTYAFTVRQPAETFMVAIDVSDSAGTVLTARHLGRRVELSDTALARAFFTIPLLAAWVVGTIHWEALKLWLKGVALRPHPAPPLIPVTIVARSSNTQGLNP